MEALDIMLLELNVAEIEPKDITQSVLNERINVQSGSEALPPERVHL